MDSMKLKLDAYCFALAEYGFDRDAIRKLQLQSAGMSRSFAIPYIVESLTGRKMSNRAQAKVLQLFTEEDERLRPQMNLFQGARDFLVAMRNRIPLVVVTGTPQEVIDETMHFFSIGVYFREVCGYPPVKAEHLQKQLQKRNLRPEQTLYVGDAIKDFEAAQAVGMPFIGINHGENPFAGLPIEREFRGLGDLVSQFG